MPPAPPGLPRAHSHAPPASPFHTALPCRTALRIPHRPAPPTSPCTACTTLPCAHHPALPAPPCSCSAHTALPDQGCRPHHLACPARTAMRHPHRRSTPSYPAHTTLRLPHHPAPLAPPCTARTTLPCAHRPALPCPHRPTPPAPPTPPCPTRSRGARLSLLVSFD
eukprot:SAG11_NODE_7259_length_1171_cov_3.118470_1_plen_165_part_01